MTKTRILIVEDESIVAKDLELTLKNLGYSVVGAAASGDAAVQKAKDCKPDLILMDIMLKGSMSGIDASKKIHETSDTPIIYLTAFADKDKMEKAKLTEPFGYIVKPFENKNLKSTIEIALSRHQIEAQREKERQNYEELYHSAPDGYLTVANDNRIIEANNTILSMTGYSMNEIRNADVTTILTGFDVRKESYTRESELVDKKGNKVPILLNSSSTLDKDQTILRTRIIIRDIRQVKILDKGASDVVKLSRRLPLTSNEKMVLAGIISHPSLTDVTLGQILNIKRSTITAIRHKLMEQNYFSLYKIPAFQQFGCELITLVHINCPEMDIKRFFSLPPVGAFLSAPELVYHLTTSKDIFGVLVSKNFAGVTRIIEALKRGLFESGISPELTLCHYPYEISTIDKMGSKSVALHLLEISLPPEATPVQEAANARTSAPILTQKERETLVALVQHPELNDSELALTANISRPSVSQLSSKLLNNECYSIFAVPNPLKIGCELMVIDQMDLSTATKDGSITLKSIICRSPHTSFVISSMSILSSIATYASFTEYDTERKVLLKACDENQVSIRTSLILPLTQILSSGLRFSPLLEKLLLNSVSE